MRGIVGTTNYESKTREGGRKSQLGKKGSVVLLGVNDLTLGVNTAKKSMGFVCMSLFASLSME